MIGRLNYENPPEPGTVLGPNYSKELLAVREVDDHGCTIRYAQTKDFQGITEPRSVTEYAMIERKRSPFGLIRSLSPYEMPVPRPLPTMAQNIEFGRRMGGPAMPAKLITGKGTNGRA